MRTATARHLVTLSKWLSDKSLTRKASLNVLTGTLEYVTRIAVSFFLNPLLVAGLGDHGYGLWRVLMQFTGYIVPLSGQATSVLKWTIAQEHDSTDYEAKRRHVGSAVGVWLLFLPLLAVLGGLLAWNVPSWLNASAEYVQTVRLACALLVVALILATLADVPYVVLEGENLRYKLMGLSPVLSVVGGGLFALAIYLDTGLTGLATGNLVRTLLAGALFLQVARTNVAWFGIAKPSLASVRRFLRLSGWFVIWMPVMQFMMSSDLVLLGIFDSVETVTVYSLTKYAPDILIILVSIIVFGTLPGLGGLIGSGELQKAVRVRSELMAFTWLVTAAVGTTVLLWVRSFTQLWVGAQYYAGSVATLLIMVMVTQFVFIRNDADVVDLTLDLRYKVLLGVFSAALCLTSAWLLIGRLQAGIVGLCLGFIGGRIVLTIGYPVLVGRFLGVPLHYQLKGVLRPLSVTVPFFLLASWLGTLITISGWVGLVLSVGATFAGVLLLAFYLGLSGNQRAWLLNRVRRAIQPST